jgi:hypothetical protein
MEVAMIRVIRFTALGALVLALGLGPIGCGGETSTTAKDSGKDRKAVEDAKKEGMKKAMEERNKEKAGGGADEKDKASEDKPKSGNKDKDK